MERKHIKKLDKLWSQKVKEDANFRCEICGKSGDTCQLHSHHIWGRRILSTRWDLDNGVCLCASHHTMGLQSAHESPAWFLKEIKSLRGDKWFKELEKQSTKSFKGIFDDVWDYLKGIIKKYV